MPTARVSRWIHGVGCLLLAGCASTGPGDDHGPHPSLPAQELGVDATGSWLAPWPHDHFSRRGTPFVHLFGLEPAFLDRDLFLDHRVARGPGGDESELEVELEWALTRRLGVVVEVPHVRVDPDGGRSEAGVGDVAIAPRALLVDSEAFLLSVNLEISLPSGERSEGLGSGELGLAPSLSAWFDLGDWVQVSAQAGTEHGLETGDAQVFYNGALVRSFLAPSPFGAAEHDHDHPGRHSPAGLTSAILELTGRTVLDGPDEGRDTAELLFGLSYNVTGRWEVRVGYQIPVGAHGDLDDALVLSLVRHF